MSVTERNIMNITRQIPNMVEQRGNTRVYEFFLQIRLNRSMGEKCWDDRTEWVHNDQDFSRHLISSSTLF